MEEHKPFLICILRADKHVNNPLATKVEYTDDLSKRLENLNVHHCNKFHPFSLVAFVRPIPDKTLAQKLTNFCRI